MVVKGSSDHTANYKRLMDIADRFGITVPEGR